MVRLGLLSLLVISTSFLTSCTRDVAKTSKLSLSMPQSLKSKVGAQSVNLGHVVINISGPGIPSTILNSWDSHDCITGNCAFPADYAINDVPAGASRLIQVIGVYKNSSGAMLFAYGDVTQNLSPGENSAVINISPLNDAGASLGGNVAGRYYDPFGFTPTSTINVKYTPPGKPTMVVERSEMFAGWFSVFGLQDLALSYELDTGHVMFAGPVNLQSAAFTSAGVYRLTVPAHSRTGGGQTQPEAGALLNFGFFGTPPSGTGCKPGSYTFTSRVDPNTSMGLSFPDMFSHAGAVSACTGTEYVNYVTLSPALYDNNGNDSVAGFRGPFKKHSSTQMVSVSGTTIQWNYLPNVDSSVIDGVRFFMKPNASGSEFNGNTDCTTLPLKGFAVVGDAMMPNTEFTSAAFSNVTNAAIVGCPFKGAKLFKSVLKTSISGGGGGGGGVATQLAVVKTRQPFNGGMEYQCAEFAVELRDANGIPTTYSSAINFNLSGDADSLHADEQLCQSYGATLSTSLTLPPMTNRFVFWARIPSQGLQGTVNFDLSYSGSPTLSPSDLTIGVKSYSNDTWVFGGPTQVLADVCYSADIVFTKYDGYQYPVGSNTTVDLTGTGVSFYSNSGCTTATSSVSITSANYSSPVYFKVASGAGPKAATMAASVGEVSSDPATVYFQLGAGSQTPANLEISDLGTVPDVGNCAGPFFARILNSSGTTVPLSSTGSISINGGAVNIDVFSDSMCGTTLPASVSTGKHEIEFYVRGNNVGHGVITANLNGIVGVRNLDMNGFYNLAMTAIDTSPVTHGTCMEFNIAPRDLFGTSIGLPNTQLVNFSSTPGLQFFAIRMGGVCMFPISNKMVQQYENSITVYASAVNMTSAGVNYTASATTAGGMPGSVGFSIATPPTMIALDTNVQNIPAEYPLNLVKAVELFTGVAPFNFIKNTGAGSLIAGVYTSADGDSASLDIVDSRTPTATTVNIVTSTLAKSATLDFTTSLPSGVSLTRSSNGYYYNSSGILTVAAANIPRFGYNPDPVSGFAPLGLLIEGPSTNLVSYSEDFLSSWTINATMASPTAATGIVNPKGITGGGNGVYMLSDNNEDVNNMGRLWYQFTADMTDNKDYVASVYVKAGTSNFFGIMLQENLVSSGGAYIDLTTGLVNKMVGPWTPQTPTGFGAQKLGGGWWRVWVKYHSSSSATYQGSLILIPAVADDVNEGYDMNAQGSVYVYGAQVEMLPVMSSYIPTSGATATRGADNVTMTINATNIPGLNPTNGSMRMEVFNLPGSMQEDYGCYIDMCYGGCSTNQLQVRRYVSRTSDYFITSGGVQQSPALRIMLPQYENTTNIIGFSWASGSANAFNYGVNGDMKTSGSQALTGPSLVNGTMVIGNSTVGNDSAFAHIKKIEYWPAKLSAPALGSF